MNWRVLCTATLLLAINAPAQTQAQSQSQQQARTQYRQVKLRIIPTRYYTIHTDLSDEQNTEVAIRLTRLFEEYQNRTRDFSGRITEKMPFYIYKSRDDYYAAGGSQGSAGSFNGHRLAAVAGEKITAATWHTIQHEAFHQFAYSVIGQNLPTWVNEGLAEYFGEAVFAGDGFVCGIVPQFRLERIRKMIQDGSYAKPEAMLDMNLDKWNKEFSLGNYDQAWSMAHFLVHAEDAKYREAFATFIAKTARGGNHKHAWNTAFGGANGFETKWKEFWLRLPDNPSRDLYARAVGQTFGAYLARALQQDQKFSNFSQFRRFGLAGQLKMEPSDALPLSLFDETVELADRLGVWGFVQNDGRITGLRGTLNDGKVIEMDLAFPSPEGTRVIFGDDSSAQNRGKLLLQSEQQK